MRRLDAELLADRARDLAGNGLNGLDLVFVELVPAVGPTQAELTVAFHNAIAVSQMDDAVNLNGVPASDIFTITGGTRIIGGTGAGQLAVLSVAAGPDTNFLVLTTSSIGDYSTYSLNVDFDDTSGDTLIDPLFASIPFKFRPGCFNLNCASSPEKGALAEVQPVVDYLARDFRRDRKGLVNAMRGRHPQ